MRIILDTNVLMSGIFFGDPPYRILQARRDERVQLAVCLEILAEYRQVLPSRRRGTLTTRMPNCKLAALSPRRTLRGAN